MRNAMERITNSPFFVGVAAVGMTDMVVQSATSGTVKPIRILLSMIFGADI